eukprot:g19909.t1
MDSDSVVSRKNLGSGGSDHDALSVTVAIGEAPSAVNVTNGSQLSPRGTVNVSALPTAVEAAEALQTNPPGNRWQNFWCGLLESDVGYVPVNDTWTRTVQHQPRAGDSHDVASPQRCCRLCQQEPRCKSWTWKDGGPRCEMYGSAPQSKEQVPGFVSGLSAVQASAEAARAALHATSPRNRQVALSDFGTAIRVDRGEKVYTRVGTPAFWAPEIFVGAYDFKVDVWALGVTTYILLCGAFALRCTVMSQHCFTAVEPVRRHYSFCHNDLFSGKRCSFG